MMRLSVELQLKPVVVVCAAAVLLACGCGGPGKPLQAPEVIRSFSAAGIELAVLVDSGKITDQQIARLTRAKKGESAIVRGFHVRQRKYFERIRARNVSHPMVLLVGVERQAVPHSGIVGVFVWGHEADAVTDEASIKRADQGEPEPHLTRVRNVVVLYLLRRGNSARIVKALARLR